MINFLHFHTKTQHHGPTTNPKAIGEKLKFLKKIEKDSDLERYHNSQQSTQIGGDDNDDDH